MGVALLLFLKPRFRTESAEILNVVTNEDRTLGHLVYIYQSNGDLYVLGHLQDIGEKQNFIDISLKFVAGLKEACGANEDPCVYMYCGGEMIDLQKYLHAPSS